MAKFREERFRNRFGDESPWQPRSNGPLIRADKSKNIFVNIFVLFCVFRFGTEACDQGGGTVSNYTTIWFRDKIFSQTFI